MSRTKCVSVVLLGSLLFAGLAGGQGRAGEPITLETLRQRVAANEKLIDPIKLSYTVTFRRVGERPQPTRGPRPGRSYSHYRGVWAQSGSRQYLQQDYFYGPHEPANSSLVVFEGQTRTHVQLPDKMSGTTVARDSHDWFDVPAAKLRLRPFENQYLLSTLLVPWWATLGQDAEVIAGRPTCVVDVVQPDAPSSSIRLWIDPEAGIPLRARVYDRHPTIPQARLILEVNDVTPYRLPNGGWIPVTGVRALHSSGNPPYSVYEHVVVDVNSITTDTPDSLFRVELPEGAALRNDISGRTILQGRPSQSYEQVVQGTAPYVAGMVTDLDGRLVSGAVVTPVTVLTRGADGHTSARFLENHERVSALSDGQGRFALKLDEAGSYELAIYATDFVDQTVRGIPPGEHDLRVALERGGTVAGQVFLWARGKKIPLADADVSVQAVDTRTAARMRGSRLRTTTDAQGRFEIGGLPVEARDRSIAASEPPRYVPLSWGVRCGTAVQNLATVTFQSRGEKREVELVLKSDVRMAPSLVGRPMPDLDDLGLNVEREQLKGHRILLCFLDVEQRPGRNCAEELAQRATSLKERGVTVLLIHEKGVDAGKLRTWTKEAGVAFPVGIISGDSDDVKFAWSVRSLPWLILTDTKHVVQAEGFTVAELDARIQREKL